MLLNVNIEFTYVQYFSTELCYVDYVSIALSYCSVSILSYFTTACEHFRHTRRTSEIAWLILPTYMRRHSLSQIIKSKYFKRLNWMEKSETLHYITDSALCDSSRVHLESWRKQLHFLNKIIYNHKISTCLHPFYIWSS